MDQDNPFWRFSVGVYEIPDVAAECLALQDSLAIDVNILLLCAWLGHRGHVIDEVGLTAIEQHVTDWHTRVVRPLRALRGDIKTMPEMARAEIQHFRKEIAAAELRAERFEQALLFEAACKLTPETAMVSDTSPIRHNISAYLARAARGRACAEPAALIAAAISYR